MPDTGAERQRRYRLRKAGQLPPLPGCEACGRQIRHDPAAILCRDCWRRLTEEGRAELRARVARSRARRGAKPQEG